MSYKVLSIKYRPQQFGDVVGQDHVTTTLRNAILRDRLGHGYIFTGPRGVGKTTSARLLAKALNCEQGQNGEPCNTCVRCVEITEGRSMDVQEIDGASTRGIDSIRELREVVKYPPTNSKYRVYIIDEVHMLTKEAFNALLKTLEEPPDHVLFIFATTEPHKVPPTILSRCQRFDFKRIGSKDILMRLNEICTTENITADLDSLTLIANKADGSLRDAQSLLDQVIAFSPDGIDLNLVRQVLGIVDIEIYFKMLDGILNQAADTILLALEDLLAGGIDVAEFLAGFAEHVRNLLLTKITNSTDLLNLTESVKQRLLTQSEKFDARELVRIQNLTLETMQQLRQATNQRVSAELLLVKLAKMSRAIALDEILAGSITPQVEKKNPVGIHEPTVKFPTWETPHKVVEPPGNVPISAEAKQAKRPDSQGVKAPDINTQPSDLPVQESGDPQPQTAAPEPKSVDLPTLEMIQSKWVEVVAALASLKPMLATFLEEGGPVAMKKETLEIHFNVDHDFQVEKLKKEKELLGRAFEIVFERPIHFRLVTKADYKAQTRKEDEIWSHPVAQHVLSLFDGEIVKD